MRAHSCRQHGHAGKADREAGNRSACARQQHGQRGGGRDRRDGEDRAQGARGGLLALVTRKPDDPEGDQAQADGPSSIQRRPHHIGVLSHAKGVDDIRDGEDQQADAEREPVTTAVPSAGDRDAGDGRHQQQVEQGVGNRSHGGEGQAVGQAGLQDRVEEDGERRGGAEGAERAVQPECGRPAQVASDARGQRAQHQRVEQEETGVRRRRVRKLDPGCDRQHVVGVPQSEAGDGPGRQHHLEAASPDPPDGSPAESCRDGLRQDAEPAVDEHAEPVPTAGGQSDRVRGERAEQEQAARTRTQSAGKHGMPSAQETGQTSPSVLSSAGSGDGLRPRSC